MKLSATYTDNNGTTYDLTGESLEELQSELASINEDAPSIEVRDEPGFIRGWISGKTWRAN